MCRAFALLGSFGDTPRHRAMSADGDEVRRTTERCIVLVGAVGAGKSSVGNALASGQNPFTARRSASGVTSTSSGAACAGPGLGGVAIVDGNETWWVIDTPGLSDGNETKPGSSDDEVLGEIVRCCASSDHRLNPTFGIDIFALVFNASGRVTAGDLRGFEAHLRCRAVSGTVRRGVHARGCVANRRVRLGSVFIAVSRSHADAAFANRGRRTRVRGSCRC